jgi:hypothetical protein
MAHGCCGRRHCSPLLTAALHRPRIGQHGSGGVGGRTGPGAHHWGATTPRGPVGLTASASRERSAQSVPKRLRTAARRQAEWGVEWLNEATLLHSPPQLATRLRSAWGFKSSHPHPPSPRADGLPVGARLRRHYVSADGGGRFDSNIVRRIVATRAGRARIPRSRDGRHGVGDDDH